MIAYLDRQQQQQQPTAGESGGADQTVFSCDEVTLSAAASDFGGLVHSLPAAVVRPATTDDVVQAIRIASSSSAASGRYHLTVAARGNGHSVSGQSTAAGGLVLFMRSLCQKIDLVVPRGGVYYADVPAGASWEEVLGWSVKKYGLSPVSWTDYLGLTVGGTLSNGGVSGQAFKRGPQVSNVAELEIVTADGECHVCSPESSPDLFFAVLGGLGQFGVITRARIPLQPAPLMVKWIRVVYGRFEDYSADAERLVTRPEPDSFDYVEGFAFVNSNDQVNGWPTVPILAGSPFESDRIPAESGPVLYCLEVVLHYNHLLEDNVDERVRQMLRPLKYVQGLEYKADVSYVDFLSRVKHVEAEARANGSWAAPHPWLNLFISARDIADFDHRVFKHVLRNGIGGPMLVYPLIRNKWDPRMSVALPENEIFYLVALLRFPRMYPDSPPIDELLAQNRQIVECCRSNSYDFKLYLPHYETESDWSRHFGNGWPRFVERKARYDPTAILAPGQKIFSHPLLS